MTQDDPEGATAPAITVRGLRKVYSARGEKIVALGGLEWQLPRGEVFGLIGANGAGKTTLLRILATLLPPTYGEISIFGHDSDEDREAVCGRIGFMPERFALYEEMKVWEYLEFFAAAHGVARKERMKTVDAIVTLTDLDVRRDSFCGTLSKGMRQRLLLAKTLLHDPDLLILDEPTDGMDPEARLWFRSIIKQLSRDGKTIVISSHLLADLSHFCTSVGVMQKGEFVVSGSVEEVKAALDMRAEIEVHYLRGRADVIGLVRDLEGVTRPRVLNGRLHFNSDGRDETKAAVLAALVNGGVQVTQFFEKEGNLEDIWAALGTTEVS